MSGENLGKARYRPKAVPDGQDVTVAAHEVRPGMWLLDPETSQWANVKQAGPGNVCNGFGAQRTRQISLRKLGAREWPHDQQIVVRVPTPAP